MLKIFDTIAGLRLSCTRGKSARQWTGCGDGTSNWMCLVGEGGLIDDCRGVILMCTERVGVAIALMGRICMHTRETGHDIEYLRVVKDVS